jgi:hypothetical protein
MEVFEIFPINGMSIVEPLAPICKFAVFELLVVNKSVTIVVSKLLSKYILVPEALPLPS